MPNPLRLGKLSYAVQTRSSLFEWSEEALALGRSLSPHTMRFGDRLWKSADAGLPKNFDGLPGLLNDCLPDGWGLYLMDKEFARGQIPRDGVTPALRLACLGERGWGSLSFRPTMDEEPVDATVDFPSLVDEIQQAAEGHLDEISERLLTAGTSANGARPKVTLDLAEDCRTRARLSSGLAPAGYASWIIKFAAREEPKDAPILEQVYMELARDMGIQTMDSEVLRIGDRIAFATRRFDRLPTRKVFAHSLSGLLNSSHRDMNLDYEVLAQLIQALGAVEGSLEQGFRRAVFNATMSVRDDHAKNFAFILNEQGHWALSPAYDLTYMEGPNGYHSMTFAKHDDKDPSRVALLDLAKAFDVSYNDADVILDQAQQLRARFPTLAQERGASEASIVPIARKLEAISKGFTHGAVASTDAKKKTAVMRDDDGDEERARTSRGDRRG